MVSPFLQQQKKIVTEWQNSQESGPVQSDGLAFESQLNHFLAIETWIRFFTFF